MIDLESVSFQYKTTPLFINFNWHIEKNDSWAILGPSGCGKSTLLSLLAGLRHPTSGNIRINNLPLSRPRPQTGLILQDYGLLPWATVRENVTLGIEIRKFYGADGVHAPEEFSKNSNVNDWLARLGVMGISSKYPAQISGGERQRTAIARTLVLKPDLLLMDEPFSSLDAPTRESLQELTNELVREQNLTMVMVTHSIEESALLGGKVLLLNGTPNQNAVIIENPDFDKRGFHESHAYQILCKKIRSIMQINREISI